MFYFYSFFGTCLEFHLSAVRRKSFQINWKGRHPSYGCHNITSFLVCLGRFSMMLMCGRLILCVDIDGGNALFFNMDIHCLVRSIDAVCLGIGCHWFMTKWARTASGRVLLPENKNCFC